MFPRAIAQRSSLFVLVSLCALPLTNLIQAQQAPQQPQQQTADNAPTTTTTTTEPLRAPDGVKKEKFALYLLVGQSNMAGRGVIGDEDRKTHPRVFSLGKEDSWIPAQEPLHFDKAKRGVGPGLTFGKTMAEAHPDLTIGLIPCAVGGTYISYWMPEAERGLFKEAVRRARLAQSTGTLKGILWQQGESDSNAARAPHYRKRLLTVLRAFRTELGDENLPIVIGGLGDFLKSSKAKVVNEALQTVAGEIGHAAFAPASTKGHIGDSLHFNSEAAHENGQAMAKAMLSLEAKQ